MSKNIIQTLMVFLLSLTFLSQSWAATAMSYHMLGMKYVKNQSIETADISHKNHAQMVHNASQNSAAISGHSHRVNHGHAMNAQVVDAQPDNIESSGMHNDSNDCCSQSCSCNSGSCSNVIGLSQFAEHALMFDRTAKILSQTNQMMSFTLTSLYRPPIVS